jgi:hypothetical protein
MLDIHAVRVHSSKSGNAISCMIAAGVPKALVVVTKEPT